jgi:hypothetical protein
MRSKFTIALTASKSDVLQLLTTSRKFKVREVNDGVAIMAPYTFSNGYPRELLVRINTLEHGRLQLLCTLRFRRIPQALLSSVTIFQLVVLGAMFIEYSILTYTGDAELNGVNLLAFTLFAAIFLSAMLIFQFSMRFLSRGEDKRLKDHLLTVLGGAHHEGGS